MLLTELFTLIEKAISNDKMITIMKPAHINLLDKLNKDAFKL